jgi:MarR family transcriptional regulator, lower aerobic nicotinate degradation pathway regulator
MSGDLDDVDAVFQLSFAVQSALTEVASAHELSITQLRLLGILRDRTPSMLDLARHLKLEKSSVTGLIDRAEARGLVEREAAPHDGRAIQVRLTAAGRRLATRLTAEADAALLRLLDALSPAERSRLSTLATAVIERNGLDQVSGSSSSASP